MEKRVLFQSSWLPWALLAPQIAIISIFFFWPAGQAVLQSFQIQDAFGLSREWVGLENFRALFADEAYLESFKTTAVFSFLVAALGISISLLLAVFADRIVRGGLFYKTLLIVPYAVAPAVAGVLWIFMFSPSIGVVAYWLSQFFGFEANYLLNANHAMALIVTAAVWKQISYNFLFFLAGLQSIPKSLIEAAAIDGARPWRRFWTITFPYIRGLLMLALLFRTIEAFKMADLVILLTKGGNGTMTISYHLIRIANEQNKTSEGAAISYIMLFIVIVLTNLYLYIANRRSAGA